MELWRPRKLDHESPDWVGPNADYFITLCADPKGKNHFCHSAIGATILESIEHRHKKGTWFCDLAVLMPDHIHMIVSFPDVPSYTKIVSEWKRWMARAHGISWQANFFDHRLRSELDRDKGEYILQNPVRAGLVGKAEDWPWYWMPKLGGSPRWLSAGAAPAPHFSPSRQSRSARHGNDFAQARSHPR